jgi:hypothetical protein
LVGDLDETLIRSKQQGYVTACSLPLYKRLPRCHGTHRRRRTNNRNDFSERFASHVAKSDESLMKLSTRNRYVDHPPQSTTELRPHRIEHRRPPLPRLIALERRARQPVCISHPVRAASASALRCDHRRRLRSGNSRRTGRFTGQRGLYRVAAPPPASNQPRLKAKCHDPDQRLCPEPECNSTNNQKHDDRY